MNKDIRLALGFWSHPKTKKLQKRIGLEAVRSLQILWMWAAQNRPDGVLTEMDTEAVEIAADWSGKDGEFLSELIGLRWVDDVDGVLSLHDWAEHNGWAAKAEERSNAARLSRLSRSNPGKANEFKAAGRVGCTVEEYNLYANPTTVERPLNDRTAVEERESTNPSTPAPAPAPAPKEEDLTSRRQTPHPDGFYSPFSIFHPDGEMKISVADFERWKEAYPLIDVGAELQALSDWSRDAREWPKKSAFHACSSALRNKNAEARKLHSAEAKRDAAEQERYLAEKLRRGQPRN